MRVFTLAVAVCLAACGEPESDESNLVRPKTQAPDSGPASTPGKSDIVMTNKSNYDIVFYAMISVMDSKGSWGQIDYAPVFLRDGKLNSVRAASRETVRVGRAIDVPHDTPVGVVIYYTTRGVSPPRFAGISGCTGMPLELEYSPDTALGGEMLYWRWPYSGSRKECTEDLMWGSGNTTRRP